MGRVLVQQPGTNTAKALTETLPKNVIIVDEDLKELRLHDGVTPGGKIIGQSAGSGVPIGTIIPFAGNSVPQGYLLCDGSAISRTDYASLFAVIGTIYGAGDGNSTFNLPKRYENFLCNYSLPNNGMWYREYSFGWLEQGGWSSSNNTNIVLPKPMLSNDYTLVGGGRGWVPAQYANSAEANHFQQRTATQFNGFGTYGFSWYIKGRGADAHPMIYLMIKYI